MSIWVFAVGTQYLYLFPSLYVSVCAKVSRVKDNNNGVDIVVDDDGYKKIKGTWKIDHF